MRLPLLAALALLAVGASAVPLLRSWRIPDTGTATLVNVSEEPDGKVRLRLFGQSAVTFRWADLTREEAASLGRALLEAAGETEKKFSDVLPTETKCVPINFGPTDGCVCEKRPK